VTLRAGRGHRQLKLRNAALSILQAWRNHRNGDESVAVEGAAMTLFAALKKSICRVIPGWSEGPGPESRDSGFDAQPVIGPRFALTRWRAPE